MKTDRDYAVEVRRLAIRVASLHLEVARGGEDASFDPARPPAGYSLCHNGHCHADDGSLVPYEEIAREAGGASSFSVLRSGTEEPVELGTEPVEVVLHDCTAQCQLERGELSVIAVDLHRIELDAVVFDQRAESRLPAEGVAFSAALMVEAEVTAAVEGRVDDGEPLGVRAAAILALPESLFDGLDWAEVSTAAAALDQIKVNLEESDALTVDLRRYDP